MAGKDLTPDGRIVLIMMNGRIIYQQLFGAFHIGIGIGNSGQQSPGIGMQGMGEELFRFRQLHDAAFVDNGDPV